MEEPKLELKKTKRQIARLTLVKARAASRVKQRIMQQKEEAKLKEIERDLMADASEESRAITADENTKKGDK